MTIQALGSQAWQALGQAKTAQASGTSSRGVFLRLDCGWIIFLGREQWRGPLTMNLRLPEPAWVRLSDAQRFQVLERALVAETDELTLKPLPEHLWLPAECPTQTLDAKQRQVQLRAVAAEVGTRQTSGLAALLPALLEDAPAPTNMMDLYARLRQAQNHLRRGESRALALALQPLLGLGEGLTPSGDDLISGLLLTLTRWGDFLQPKLDQEALHETLLPLALRQTSTLAANLITCAAYGQADERLLAALDGFVSGNRQPAECAALLAGWGHRSGTDALVGMSLVVSAD